MAVKSGPKTKRSKQTKKLIEPECIDCRKYAYGNKCASCTWKEFGYDVVDIKEDAGSIFNIRKMYAEAAAAAQASADGTAFLDPIKPSPFSGL